MVSTKAMVALKDVPSEGFKHPVLEKLCKTEDFTKEISKFESTKIRQRNKAVEFVELINRDSIDIEKVKQLAFSGLPEDFQGLRPLVWRIILGGLSDQIAKWDEVQAQNFETYEGFKRELIVKPKLKDEEAQAKQQQAMIDHPLSTSTTSVWNTYFKDQEIWDEIEKDVKRTRSDMYFFYLAIDPTRNITAEDKARLERQADTKRADMKPEDRKNYIETHADILHRILFIYAKLNPGIKYIQGMNEVLAVLYYCFLKGDDYDTDNEGANALFPRKFHESDLFFCFTNLMVELKDGFLRELDKEKTGIQGRIKTYAEILRIVEPHVHHTIEANQVNH
mmetsp:Transcript_11005/g.16688  ORF Transcript_11005/g.16688 Transcript_11005/m.16688 type:complete len:336 (-) Transcript_11005:371-1378(-)